MSESLNSLPPPEGTPFEGLPPPGGQLPGEDFNVPASLYEQLLNKQLDPDAPVQVWHVDPETGERVDLTDKARVLLEKAKAGDSEANTELFEIINMGQIEQDFRERFEPPNQDATDDEDDEGWNPFLGADTTVEALAEIERQVEISNVLDTSRVLFARANTQAAQGVLDSFVQVTEGPDGLTILEIGNPPIDPDDPKAGFAELRERGDASASIHVYNPPAEDFNDTPKTTVYTTMRAEGNLVHHQLEIIGNELQGYDAEMVKPGEDLQDRPLEGLGPNPDTETRTTAGKLEIEFIKDRLSTIASEYGLGA